LCRVQLGLDVHKLSEAYFQHSLGDCVLDFECLLADCSQAKRSEMLKAKAKKSKAQEKPKKQLDFGKLTHEALLEQRSLLEGRVLAWLKDIPIGGAEERHYDPKPMVRFAESWNLFHLTVDEIYVKQVR
jgi:hypothetical protein